MGDEYLLISHDSSVGILAELFVLPEYAAVAIPLMCIIIEYTIRQAASNEYTENYYNRFIFCHVIQNTKWEGAFLRYNKVFEGVLT